MASLESEPPTTSSLGPPRRPTATFSRKWPSSLAAACAIARLHLHPVAQRPLFLPYGSRTKLDGPAQRTGFCGLSHLPNRDQYTATGCEGNQTHQLHAGWPSRLKTPAFPEDRYRSASSGIGRT